MIPSRGWVNKIIPSATPMAGQPSRQLSVTDICPQSQGILHGKKRHRLHAECQLNSNILHLFIVFKFFVFIKRLSKVEYIAFRENLQCIDQCYEDCMCGVLFILHKLDTQTTITL